MASDRDGAPRLAADRYADHPPPKPPCPAHPQDLDLGQSIVFAARTVMWNMEEIFMGRTADDDKELPKRAAESRVLAELNRTLQGLVRLHKAHAADRVTERTDDDLKRELLEGFRKIDDARRAGDLSQRPDAGGAPVSEG